MPFVSILSPVLGAFLRLYISGADDMACFYPVNAYKSRRLNESGKRSIVFNIRDGFQDMALQVPCGKCTGCKADRAMMWSIRAYHEASLHERNSFLTLTYAESPPTLIKKDLQDFFKRARHHYDFRYFACGEYGDTTRRPHYHALFFGEDFLGDSYEVSDTLYSNPHLESLWGHGLVSIAPVNMAVCCYVVGYVNKKIGDEDTFTLMSRRPGIGKDWLARYSDDIRRTGTVTIEGKELPVPLRYMAWHESEFQELKKARKRRFDALTPDQRYQRAVALPNKELAAKAILKMRSKPL